MTGLAAWKPKSGPSLNKLMLGPLFYTAIFLLSAIYPPDFLTAGAYNQLFFTSLSILRKLFTHCSVKIKVPILSDFKPIR